MDLAEILQAVLKLGLLIFISLIGHTILDQECVRAFFAVFVRAVCAVLFFLHILVQTPQTEVHTKNQLPRYPRSGPIELTRTDRQTDRNRCF